MTARQGRLLATRLDSNHHNLSGPDMSLRPLLNPAASLALVALLMLASADALAFKCMPLYGNWCGIDHPSRGFPPPVDAFDAACMRHDLCTASPGSDTPCDIAFVEELHRVAAQAGYLPRSLQWAEYVIRLKAGGPWGGMPMPTPGDAMGVMSSLLSPCW